MKTLRTYTFTLLAALLSNGLSHAGADRPARAAVEHSISVKRVQGTAEYAYDSTGWKPLAPGKVLHAGAHVRTGADSAVLLAMEERGSLVRVGPSSRLELAKAAPITETTIIIPFQATRVPASTTTFALDGEK